MMTKKKRVRKQEQKRAMLSDLRALQNAVDRIVHTITARRTLYLVFVKLCGLQAVVLTMLLMFVVLGLGVEQLIPLLVVVSILHVLCVMYLILSWRYHKYSMNDEKIIVSKGVLFRREVVCAIKNIESITLQQGFIQKLFRFGTLRLYAPTLKKVIVMKDIPEPERYMIYIESLISSSGDAKLGSDLAFIS